jgi:hypothetical protein
MSRWRACTAATAHPRLCRGVVGLWVSGAAMAGMAAFVACGGTSKPAAPLLVGHSQDARTWAVDDRSLCQNLVHWRNNAQLQVNESAGPGSVKPNVRRVYKVIGERDDRHAVLICREIDTNLDGIKDVVRTFSEKGEPLHEEADTNFDGKIDHWVKFSEGRIQEEDIDTTLSASRPNLWKFYVNGELSRVRRNTHCASGKADTWEIYYKNRLERVGNDTSCDGHVDRWDRDQILAQEEGQAVDTADGGSSGTSPVTVGLSGQITDGGVADAGARSKRPAR